MPKIYNETIQAIKQLKPDMRLEEKNKIHY